MKLSLAYSPCPNDTFMFHDLAQGRIRPAGCFVEVHLHDIEVLNQLAMEHCYDVTKLSFPAWLRVRDEYRLLDSGAALGFGCGPILVSKSPLKRSDVARCKVAIPGELTTAHLLFSLWSPETSDKVFVRFDKIMKLVEEGQVDCGVVIHEGRFVYDKNRLIKIVDLGEWLEHKTGLPVPLAGIAMRKRFSSELTDEFETQLKASILNSRSNLDRVLPYIKQHAQEMSPEVLRQHIDTFVTESSLAIGEDGRAAVNRLEQMALEAGLIS